MKDLINNQKLTGLASILLGSFFIYKLAYAVGKAIAHFTN